MALAKVILLTSKYYPQSGTPCVLFLLGFIRKRKSSFLYPDDQIQLRTSQWSLQNSSTIRWRKKEIVTLSVFWLERFYFSGFSTVLLPLRRHITIRRLCFTAFPDTSKVVRRTPLRVVREISPRSVCKCMCTLKRGLNFFFNLYICDLQNR